MATLPTKIGGDDNVLARTVNVECLRPLFTGDTIRWDVNIEKSGFFIGYIGRVKKFRSWTTMNRKRLSH